MLKKRTKRKKINKNKKTRINRKEGEKRRFYANPSHKDSLSKNLIFN
jgi:hypothetical protein